MILKYLINPKPTIILFFIVFSLAFNLIWLFSDNIEVLFKHTWLPSYIVILIGLLVTSFHALGLNNLIYEKNIIKKDNLVLGFTYILLCTPFYNTITHWVISFALLFYINCLFASYQKDYPFSYIFNASLILCILTFFAPEIIFLAPIIIIAGINYENLSLRSLIVMLMGFGIPIFFYFITLKLLNAPLYLPNFNGLEIMSIPDYQTWKLSQKIWAIIVILVSLFSVIELFQWLYKKSIRSRKAFIIVLFYFISLFLIGLYNDEGCWYYLLSPLSIIMANYFIYTKKRKIANLLFLLLIVSSIIYKCMIII